MHSAAIQPQSRGTPAKAIPSGPTVTIPRAIHSSASLEAVRIRMHIARLAVHSHRMDCLALICEPLAREYVKEMRDTLGPRYINAIWAQRAFRQEALIEERCRVGEPHIRHGTGCSSVPRWICMRGSLTLLGWQPRDLGIARQGESAVATQCRERCQHRNGAAIVHQLSPARSFMTRVCSPSSFPSLPQRVVHARSGASENFPCSGDRRLEFFARQRTELQPGFVQIAEKGRVAHRGQKGTTQFSHAFRWRSRGRDHGAADQRGRREQLQKLAFVVASRQVDHAGDVGKCRRPFRPPFGAEA